MLNFLHFVTEAIWMCLQTQNMLKLYIWWVKMFFLCFDNSVVVVEFGFGS